MSKLSRKNIVCFTCKIEFYGKGNTHYCSFLCREAGKEIKYNTRRLTNLAIKHGVLKKQPCVVCGHTKVDAHHNDYENPLDITWLCNKHHSQHHKTEVRDAIRIAEAAKFGALTAGMYNMTETKIKSRKTP